MPSSTCAAPAKLKHDFDVHYNLEKWILICRQPEDGTEEMFYSME